MYLKKDILKPKPTVSVREEKKTQVPNADIINDCGGTG